MNKKNNKYVKLIILICIIILLLFLTRCSKDNMIIESAREYIKKSNIIIKEDYNLKVSELLNYGYKLNIKQECINHSYVNIKNNNDNLEYNFNLICSKSELTLDLIGDDSIEIEYGNDYVESSAFAYYNNQDITNKIQIDSSKLDLNKVGTYKIVYKVDTDGIYKEIERTVKIVDTINPIITLKNNNYLIVNIGSEYKDAGYTALDNYDKDITNKVIVSGNVDTNKAGTYIIKYEVSDSSLNKTTVERTIIVKDEIYPTLTLKGFSTMYLDYPLNFIEPGYIASDIIDKDITNKVIVSGNVDTKKLGNYNLIYSVKNSSNQTVITTRTIIVRDIIKPTISLFGGSYINLEYPSNYIEYGASASDNYDGDITNSIIKLGYINKNVLGQQYITYTVTDTSGNTTSTQRVVEIKDSTKPLINIDNDKRYIIIERSTDYNILDGVTAIDNYDGNITNKIIYESSPNYDNNKIGEYTINYIVKDTSGNISNTETKTIIVKDTIPPTININYSTKNPTNQTVRVTLNSNEVIKINDSSWVCDEFTCYKDYNQNIEEEITVLDLSLNKNILPVSINNIDTNKPIGSILINPNTLTNGNVDVVISTDKEVLPIEGWVRIDNNNFKKTYTENIIEDILIEDIYGNVNTINIVVDNINRILPVGTLSYNTKNTNQDILVTLLIDKEVLDIEGWTKVDDKTFTKVYTQNTIESVNFIDKYGNIGNVDLDITNINKIKPILNSSYSPNLSDITNGDVIVTVTSSKEVTSNTAGFVCTVNTCIKTYTTNTNEVLTVVDTYGNTENISIDVTNIDKLKPIVNVSYSKPTSTNEDVLVTITANEDITIDDYNCANNICTKTYTTNIDEIITIYDKVFNANTFNININWIDRIPPVITVDTNNVSIMVGSNYDLKTGVTAFDTYDGDITNNITVTSSPTFNNNSIGTYTIYYNVTDESGNQAVQKIRTVSVEECIDNGVTASAPVIPDNMIPIKYDGTKWIKADKDNTDNDWYDYKTQTWANAVTVTPETRDNYLSAPIGTPVLESDILTYLVWVPRYSYAIKSESLGITNGQSQICINFESKLTPKSTGTGSNTSFYTHPAFTFGNTELDGIWVGKFEMTGSISRLTTKPNLASIRSQTVNSMFNNTLAMKNENNIYGYPTSGVDTHMMKNSEWGAVTYLSQSKYGKYGNDNFTGTNKEIYINPSQGYITGRSGNVPNQAALADTSGGSSSSLYGYDGANCITKTGFVCTGTKHETNGMAASTTGNIYGIYDMSGGSYDCVMANLNNTISNSGFTSIWFTTPENEKYYDKYTKASALLSYESGLKGDAVYETGGWYGNYIGYLNSTRPWFNRGGLYSSASSAGIFAFYNGDGISSASNSWRFVLTE